MVNIKQKLTALFKNVMSQWHFDQCFLSTSSRIPSLAQCCVSSSRYAVGLGGDGGGDAIGRECRLLLYYQLSSWRKEIRRIDVHSRPRSYGELLSLCKQGIRMLMNWSGQYVIVYG